MMNTIKQKQKVLDNVTEPGTGHEVPQTAMDSKTIQKTIQKVTEGNGVGEDKEVSKPTSFLPTTKTQAQPTPMPSLSPVLAQSPAQSAGASPQPTSAKVLASHSSVLAQNANWLAQAGERIEKTIELINIKKIKDALQILLEIN